MPKPSRRKSPVRAQHIKRNLSPPTRSSLANNREIHSSASPVARNRANLRILLCTLSLIFAQLPLSAQAKSSDKLDILTAPLIIGFTPNPDLRLLLIHELFQAKARIDIAMFVLTEPLLIDTLCNIASRKPRDGSPPVQVNILLDNRRNEDNTETEDERNDREMLAKLHHHGVNIRLHDNDGSGLQHMKTAVVDQKVLLTGAANWSSMAFHHNIEDVLVIRDEKIAQAYYQRITTLAEKARPYDPEGLDKTANSIQRKALRTEDTSRLVRGRWHSQLEKNPLITPFHLPPHEDITIIFPHHQRYLPVMLELLAKTENNLTAAFFSLTHDSIRRAIVEREELPTITLLLDEIAFRRELFRKRLHRMQEAGAEVLICMNDGKDNCMHLKAAVFDGKILWRGTANWSVNANERFHEEILIFRCETLAQHYLRHLQHIKNTLCKEYLFQ